MVFSTSLTSGEDLTGQAAWRQNLDELRQLMLGFDVDPAHTARVFAQWGQFREASSDSDELRRQEDEILNIFVDICSLFRRKPGTNDPSGGEAPSPEAYLVHLLAHDQDPRRRTSTGFVDALRRALAHYGITYARSFARAGRDFALDLQVPSTRGSADHAYSRSAGTASASRANC